MVIKRLDTLFIFHVPKLDEAIRSRTDELHTSGQKVDSEHGVGMPFKSLASAASHCGHPP